jgi:hypothetical protein
MGRSEEEVRKYQKAYQKAYYLSRKDTDNEYYKLASKRSYYRRLLRDLPSESLRRDSITEQINTISSRLEELKNNRTRYKRLGLVIEHEQRDKESQNGVSKHQRAKNDRASNKGGEEDLPSFSACDDFVANRSVAKILA